MQNNLNQEQKKKNEVKNIYKYILFINNHKG